MTAIIDSQAGDAVSQLPDLRLLANFVHQLINPLNGVIGTIDNLIDGTTSIEKLPQRLNAARAQLEFAVMIARNLAYFTEQSMTAGAIKERDISQLCVLPQLIIEAAQFFQELAKLKGVSIQLLDSRTQYAIKGSPELIRQVFMNILDNAVKYSDRDCQVVISSRIQKRTNNLILEIKNHGAGFTNIEAKSIFKAGVRGSEAQKLIASGTGLGLYICKMIICDYHKSIIEAEYSASARCVTIRLRFPNWSIL